HLRQRATLLGFGMRNPPNGSKDLTELTDTPDDEWVEEPDEVSRQRGSPEIEFAELA
ncbi:hypothetical protein L0F63_003626, partial [Massospora cicadina]